MLAPDLAPVQGHASSPKKREIDLKKEKKYRNHIHQRHLSVICEQCIVCTVNADIFISFELFDIFH